MWKCVFLILTWTYFGNCVYAADHFRAARYRDTPKRCTYTRTYKMEAVDCSERDLDTVPNNLKDSIEIMDASRNRIRRIRKNTFSRYTDIRFLYLSHNVITSIDPESFDVLTELEVLDLSVNGLREIPSTIFYLESLRKLYISQNDISVDSFKGSTHPITAPLEYIDISDNDLDEFPDFGIMPRLVFLNASENQFDRIQITGITSLCALKTLNISSPSDDYRSSCSCFKLKKWAIYNSLHLIPNADELCNDEEGQNCRSDVAVDKNLDTGNEECKKIMEEIVEQQKVQRTWLSILIVVIVLTVILAAVLYLWYVRNKKAKEHNKSQCDDAESPFKPEKNIM